MTPRDFDLSPYFEIVKFNHLGDPRLNYRDIVWEESPPVEAGVVAAAHRSPPSGGALGWRPLLAVLMRPLAYLRAPFG